MKKLILFLIISLLATSGFCAVEFNTDNAIKLLGAFGTHINLDVGTLAVWVYPHFALDQTGTYYFINDTSTSRYAFFFSDATTDFQISIDGRSTDFNSVTGAANQWYHIAVVYNKTGSVQKLFINGIEQTGDAQAGTWGANGHGTYFYVGSRISNPFLPFDGVMSEMTTWTTELTDDEILLLANSRLKRLSCQIQADKVLNSWDFTCVEGTKCTSQKFNSVCGSGGDWVQEQLNNDVTGSADTYLSYP